MSTTPTALVVGLVLGIVATFGGFGTFVVVLVFGAIGLVVGRVLEGKLDLRSLTGQSSARARAAQAEPAPAVITSSDSGAARAARPVRGGRAAC